MILNSNVVGVIADDLTGANDTALQFQQRGANTQILLSNDVEPCECSGVQVWAIPTESRNVTPQEAYERVSSCVESFLQVLKPDHFYKKIDSTVRGNIAVECLGILSSIGGDAVVVIPAFPLEGRITVGGYHLLHGVPIERTEMARDPHSPIFESHLPTLFKSQLPEEYHDTIDTINLSVVMKGAGPILLKLNELIKCGKKLIIVDAVSTVDIEQIVLAITKSDYNILPAGNAAAAKAFSTLWFPNLEVEQAEKNIPNLPKFIVSGSATQITANQIKTLEDNPEFQDKLVSISLDMLTILGEIKEELVQNIVSNLAQGKVVMVHTSNLMKTFDSYCDESLRSELTKVELANIITEFLANLTKQVMSKIDFILITLGGETSYKCCATIDAKQLKLIDEVVPAIALSKDLNSRYLVTKSGNLGNENTLIDILKYFN